MDAADSLPPIADLLGIATRSHDDAAASANWHARQVQTLAEWVLLQAARCARLNVQIQDVARRPKSPLLRS